MLHGVRSVPVAAAPNHTSLNDTSLNDTSLAQRRPTLTHLSRNGPWAATALVRSLEHTHMRVHMHVDARICFCGSAWRWLARRKQQALHRAELDAWG